MSTQRPGSFLERYAPPPMLAGPLAMLCWAASIVVVKDAAGVVPPAAMSFLRCLLAMALLYPMCHRNLRVQWPLMKKHWKIIGLLGGLLFLGGNGMLFVGLQFTSAINAALINSAEPVIIVAVAWIMFRDRLTPVQWAGVVISLIGVIYLVGQGDINVLFDLRLNAGDLFIVISIITWAFYSVLMRRVPRELDRLCLVFGILMAGATLVFPFWILENIYYAPTPLIWATVWTTAFNAIFASILALFWWNHAIEGLGPGRAGLFIHLIPVYTVLLAMGFLGEELFDFHAIGIGLIAIGIFLTTMLKSKKESSE